MKSNEDIKPAVTQKETPIWEKKWLTLEEAAT